MEFTEEHKKNISLAKRGKTLKEENSRWKGGIGCGFVRKIAMENLFKENRKFDKCELCKKYKNNLQIHHKDRNRQNNNPENLWVVCISCHRKQHPNRKIINRCLNCGRFSNNYHICPKAERI